LEGPVVATLNERIKGVVLKKDSRQAGMTKIKKNLNIRGFTQAKACGYPFLFFGIPKLEFV
jgi:hypothetical protein